ncbi:MULTISPECIES: hypothetical protein [Pseudoalteromonas]|uniref:Uncharacterized protein n=1 Tax=Pseudoalteromonas amylolytica TaxID=1859457 RepID=A0A1S1MZW0_9GAMM|nr:MULTISPECIES: hypothetical protein [Pseudoalteromonas]OHU85502.1 hypothetical protein BFC16_19330 [Pseudoalteromonas sp. JW3]OHU91736.1 hypothetical protein BET10_08025 [Pseudoalteromonas amylolytica]
MPYSIEINEGFFSAKFVVSNNINNTRILSVLGKYDPNGVILDSVNGNTKAAYAILLGAKLYECKQLEKVNSSVSFTNEFTNRYSDIAILYKSDWQGWDVKISKFCLLPDFSIEEVA